MQADTYNLDRQTDRQTDTISLFLSMKKVNIKLFINAE